MAENAAQLIDGIAKAKAGDWEAAHAIAQSLEGVPMPIGCMPSCIKLKATSATAAIGMAAPTRTMRRIRTHKRNWTR